MVDRAIYGDAPTQVVDYLYDLENRWIGRLVDFDGDGLFDQATAFVYDGNQIVLEFDGPLSPPLSPTTGTETGTVAFGTDADATIGPASSALTAADLAHRYLWQPDAVDQLMADEQTTSAVTAGEVIWPLGDHLGTIRDLAARSGPGASDVAVVNHRALDAFGNLTSESNAATDCLFAFTGRPLDQTTGLQNNHHRWYDANTGRWISQDPVGFEGRDGNQIRYIGNCVTIGADPNGLLPPSWDKAGLPPAPGNPNVYYKKVVGLVSTGGCTPGVLSAGRQLIKDLQTLDVLNSLGDVTMSAAKASRVIKGALDGLAAELAKQMSPQNLAPKPGGIPGKLNNQQIQKNGGAYKLFVVVTYWSIEPGVWGYKYVGHTKYVEIVAPPGASLFPGFWGGDAGRDPTAEELLEGIMNALK